MSGEPSEFWPKTGTLNEIGMDSYERAVRSAFAAGTIPLQRPRNGSANVTFRCGVRNRRSSLRANAFGNGSTKLTRALASRLESGGTLWWSSWSVLVTQKKTSRGHPARLSRSSRRITVAANTPAMSGRFVANPDQLTQPSPPEDVPRRAAVSLTRWANAMPYDTDRTETGAD